MIKRILVALDADEDTPAAIRYAIELGKSFDAGLTGLTVVDQDAIALSVGGGGIGTSYYAEQLRRHYEEKTRKEAGALLSDFEHKVSRAGLRHAETMEEGVTWKRIIEDMKFHDLLILGRESHYFYSRPDQDTKTLAKVVKNGNVPTLVTMESYRPVKRVMVACDGSGAAARTLQWFIHLEPFGREVAVDLVSVIPSESEQARKDANLVLRLTEDYLGMHGYGEIIRSVRVGKTPGEALMEHQKETSADLAVLGAHSMSALRRIAFGSTTHHLVVHSPVPLFMSH